MYFLGPSYINQVLTVLTIESSKKCIVFQYSCIKLTVAGAFFSNGDPGDFFQLVPSSSLRHGSKATTFVLAPILVQYFMAINAIFIQYLCNISCQPMQYCTKIGLRLRDL